MNELALITGGAKGIGFAIAKKCHALGKNVILLDKDEKALEEATEQLGEGVYPFSIDLSKTKDLLACAKKILEEVGVPNYLFNNAGIGGPSKPLWQQDLKSVQTVMQVNFFSAFTLTKFFLPLMLEKNLKGAIVNTASMASFYTAPLIGSYVISKHTMMAFSECLYHDLQALQSEIQVAVVCPGGVKTTILDKRGEDHASNSIQVNNTEQEHFLIKFAKLIKKGMSPDVVADIIFSGLEHKQFYIFTHPNMLSIVEDRLNAVLAKTQPQLLDL